MVWFYSISITIIIIIISCYLFLSFFPFRSASVFSLGEVCVWWWSVCVYVYVCVCVGVVLVIGASPSPGSPIPTASHPTPAILITVIHKQKKSVRSGSVCNLNLTRTTTSPECTSGLLSKTEKTNIMLRRARPGTLTISPIRILKYSKLRGYRYRRPSKTRCLVSVSFWLLNNRHHQQANFYMAIFAHSILYSLGHASYTSLCIQKYLLT